MALFVEKADGVSVQVEEIAAISPVKVEAEHTKETTGISQIVFRDSHMSC